MHLYESTITKELIHEFRVPRVVRYLRTSETWLLWPLRHTAKRWLAGHLSHAYQMGVAYLRAQQALLQATGATHALETVSLGVADAGGPGAHEDGVGERARSSSVSSGALVNIVASLHTPMAKRVAARMQKMQREFPRITRVVQTRHAANMALRHQRHVLQRAREEGELTEADAIRLVSAVNRKLKSIYLEPMKPWGGPNGVMLNPEVELPGRAAAADPADPAVAFPSCCASLTHPRGTMPRARCHPVDVSRGELSATAVPADAADVQPEQIGLKEAVDGDEDAS
mgnify:CR=1 FL=1